ncbi:hypothetical protein [Nocardioides speluncae]|uniref:hypothetical protein n=1 Tax=Nocardioides speluncae TaxID=2670337 RepID=UPI000D687CE1|nr:hypothetical protein [Nocardioides speluncae]
MATQASPAARSVRGTQHAIVNLSILGTLAWLLLALAVARFEPGSTSQLDPLLPLALAAAGLAWLPVSWVTSNLALWALRARASFDAMSGPRQGAVAVLASAPLTFAVVLVWFAAS